MVEGSFHEVAFCHEGVVRGFRLRAVAFGAFVATYVVEMFEVVVIGLGFVVYASLYGLRCGSVDVIYVFWLCGRCFFGSRSGLAG